LQPLLSKDIVSENALVAELVDALDSKSSAFGRGGSIPPQGTKIQGECEKRER
jgi:hypothetical protein